MAGSRARQRCFLAGDRLWRPCLYRQRESAAVCAEYQRWYRGWQTRVAGEALSRPVVSDGMVLVHTSNGQLQALNETDGAVKWTVNLDMPALSCAASLRLRPPTARRRRRRQRPRQCSIDAAGADDLAAAYFYGHRPDGN